MQIDDFNRSFARLEKTLDAVRDTGQELRASDTKYLAESALGLNAFLMRGGLPPTEGAGLATWRAAALGFLHTAIPLSHYWTLGYYAQNLAEGKFQDQSVPMSLLVAVRAMERQDPGIGRRTTL